MNNLQNSRWRFFGFPETEILVLLKCVLGLEKSKRWSKRSPNVVSDITPPSDNCPPRFPIDASARCLLQRVAAENWCRCRCLTGAVRSCRSMLPTSAIRCTSLCSSLYECTVCRSAISAWCMHKKPKFHARPPRSSENKNLTCVLCVIVRTLNVGQTNTILAQRKAFVVGVRRRRVGARLV